ncbi:MAG: restriction endonuclease subunit S [Thermoanaerobaculia bacterium]
MAGEWRSSTWGEEISLEYGKALRGHDEAQGAYRVFGANGPIGWSSRPLAPGPGVILGRKGAYRGVQYSPEPFFVIDTAYYVVPKNELDMRWLYYAIKHYKLGEVDDGSPIPSTTRSAVYMLDLEVPPSPEQRAIAHILGALDDKIELNRRMNETLEAMARALFKSWFVDFDPVRAKAEGRDPGLPKPLADLFPDSFEDSELGEIPKGWRVGPILEAARLLSGGTPKTDRAEYWGGGIPWASAKDVSQCDDSFLVETERKITDRGLKESATQLIPTLCSAVVARGATTGRMVVLGEAMAMNQTCYALETSAGTPFALYCQLRQEIDHLVHAAHGSVFDTITTSTFATSKVVLPSRPLLREFELRVDSLFRRVLAGIKASRVLASLRDTLLPKLISGELRVSDARRFVAEAPA